MTRKVKELRDLEIDEISLVDKGANQHARTVIAKRHDEEDNMDEYFDEEGNPVDAASLELGDVIFDAEGNAYAVDVDDDDDDDEYEVEYEDEQELVGVGKRYTAEDLRTELSKAMSDDDRDEIVAKAFDALASYQEIAASAQISAETERQLRLDREYTEIAKNYAVGVEPEVLGPVLKRLAETLSDDDCMVIAKALDSASAAVDLFTELGVTGTGANSDVFNEVEHRIDQRISKSETDNTRETEIAKAFADDPQAYDEYLAEQRQNRY